MTKINFYTGSYNDLDNKALEDGAIYFVPGEDNHAIVAYDMDGQRYYVSADTEENNVISSGTFTPSGTIN